MVRLQLLSPTHSLASIQHPPVLPPPGDAITTYNPPSESGQSPHSVFVLPESQRWPLSRFLDLIDAKLAGSTAALHGFPPGVFYLSHQNGNLTDEQEFGEVLLKSGDIELDHPFARAAFGAPPDARNVWIGLSDALTTLHKDPYDNIYSVIRGTKIFTIYPPSDVIHLTESVFPTMQYHQRADGTFEVGS